MARSFIAATLRNWDATQRDCDIVMVVSELLTNALRHALPTAAVVGPRPIRLGMLHFGPCVLCAVADPSEQVPVPREPDSLGESGRGLQVIGALSDGWGYTVLGPGGKAVWAIFSLSASSGTGTLANEVPGLLDEAWAVCG